jgi:hypothetical protein
VQKNEVVISGRDTGAGVFGAYTPDNIHVRLLRFGSGSIAVGSLSGLPAAVIGTATGIDGRIWVMWGQGGGPVAVTRSNKAVTRFEPIQRLNIGSASLFRLSGDGRLGPLDLFVDRIPSNGKDPGSFYTRILPELTAMVSVSAIKNNKGVVTAHKVTVTVTDAGDPVAGATVHLAGHTATTNGIGRATITLPASVTGKHSLTVTAPTYHALVTSVSL